MQKLVDKLQAKHGDTYNKIQYKLWAKAMDVNKHSSMIRPPLGAKESNKLNPHLDAVNVAFNTRFSFKQTLTVWKVTILSELLDRIHNVYGTEGTIKGEKFVDFMQDCLLPALKPFNYLNSHSGVIMNINNANIHHVQNVHLIENQAEAKLLLHPTHLTHIQWRACSVK